MDAFESGRNFRKGNTEVQEILGGVQLLLHGNIIAKKLPEGLFVSNAGWTTKTTKERLSGICGVFINQNKGVWYLNGEEMPYDQFVKVWNENAVTDPPNVMTVPKRIKDFLLKRAIRKEAENIIVMARMDYGFFLKRVEQTQGMKAANEILCNDLMKPNGYYHIPWENHSQYCRSVWVRKEIQKILLK